MLEKKLGVYQSSFGSLRDNPNNSAAIARRRIEYAVGTLNNGNGNSVTTLFILKHCSKFTYVAGPCLVVRLTALIPTVFL